MNSTHTQIRRYLSVPLTLTLLGLTVITPLQTLAETALNRQQEYDTERSGKQKHFDGNTLISVWYESNNWSIDRRYQIESEIELEEPLDWDKIEVNLDRDFSLVSSPEI
ncbi:hypothetical protein Sta7437_4820 (plasmid) [Stanieria cyanosphaera PCC 7437]|uniref:Uncharacterized protein n=1 Tax=Stanieria cyanosphaera (strain ATCC 29371 / PCC 7437) TaxID=111780 RepID=K9Y1P5_STAC7|nr:hypothetical protein [Stanieria cyanosphaera]AFZ38254.1 hypothetical protein Sta7437_4820 [Stanieria cyanosphaera PCC 7437]